MRKDNRCTVVIPEARANPALKNGGLTLVVLCFGLSALIALQRG